MSDLPREKGWLGGRDSNPDTQIQSLSNDGHDIEDKGLSSAERGKVRQNPQYGRNENLLARPGANPPGEPSFGRPVPALRPGKQIHVNALFDWEEETLP